MGKGRKAVPEREVLGMWRQHLAQGQGLTTTTGERLEVLYPGRASGEGGPDFRDAVIVLGGERHLKGDIELHVCSSQWWQHGHHRCPSYDKVILHVVLWDDAAMPDHFHNPGVAPVLALDRLGNEAVAVPVAALPCRDVGTRLTPAQLKEVLDEAGEVRFRDKGSRFQRQMEHQDPDQVLYGGLLQALGYSKNQEPFLALAQALSWRRLSAEARAAQQPALVLQSRLLGGAGLLPSQRSQATVPGEPWVEALEAAWRRLGPARRVPGLAFHRDRVRPENLPVRRLAAAGLLLGRFLEGGLAAGMAELAASAASDGRRGRLETALEVAATGFWASHLDFGMNLKRKAPALLGRGRVGDMVVNVVLPFLWVWADTTRPALQARALELYRRQPRLQDNSITRHMMQQLAIAPKLVTLAAQQQGLLHSYKAYCTQGACPQCRLSRA